MPATSLEAEFEHGPLNQLPGTAQVLQFTATDPLSIRTFCPAKVVKQGAFTIPTRKMMDLLRLPPDGDITVKVLANNWVQLRSGPQRVREYHEFRHYLAREELMQSRAAMVGRRSPKLDLDIYRRSWVSISGK